MKTCLKTTLFFSERKKKIRKLMNWDSHYSSIHHAVCLSMTSLLNYYHQPRKHIC